MGQTIFSNKVDRGYIKTLTSPLIIFEVEIRNTTTCTWIRIGTYPKWVLQSVITILAILIIKCSLFLTKPKSNVPRNRIGKTYFSCANTVKRWYKMDFSNCKKNSKL